MGDVDGIVELGGNFLLLEWKAPWKEECTGQRILFKRFSEREGCLVVVVTGDAETMLVQSSARYWRGVRDPLRGFDPKSLAGVMDTLKRWAEWAAANRKA